MAGWSKGLRLFSRRERNPGQHRPLRTPCSRWPERDSLIPAPSAWPCPQCCSPAAHSNLCGPPPRSRGREAPAGRGETLYTRAQDPHLQLTQPLLATLHFAFVCKAFFTQGLPPVSLRALKPTQAQASGGGASGRRSVLGDPGDGSRRCKPARSWEEPGMGGHRSMH